jgi:type IV pilus assembly protein PilA
MKTEFKAKFLNHLIQRKQDDKGFTLIELLVVIIIIGILAAIALPAFLNQANKARQSEAKTNVGSMNRAQQAYYLEKSTFIGNDTPTNFAKLGLGIKTQTSNYTYEVSGTGTNLSEVTNRGITKAGNSAFKSYIGGVNIGTIQGTGEATTLVVLCEGVNAPVSGGPQGSGETATYNTTDGPSCPAGKYEEIK